MDLQPKFFKAGEDYPVAALFVDADQNALTGLTPDVQIMRKSDGYVLDNDGNWVNPNTTPTLPTLTENDATYYAGLYEYLFAVPAAAYGERYYIRVDGGSTASNRYWDELLVSVRADWNDVDLALAGAAGPWRKTVSGTNAGRLELLDRDDNSTVLKTFEPPSTLADGVVGIDEQ